MPRFSMYLWVLAAFRLKLISLNSKLKSSFPTHLINSPRETQKQQQIVIDILTRFNDFLMSSYHQLLGNS